MLCMSFVACISSTQVPVMKLQHAYVMQNNMLERYYESRGICISCLNQFQIGLDLYQSYIGSILNKPSRKQFETSHFLQLQGLGFRQIMGIICQTFWQWQKGNRLPSATLVCLLTKMKLAIINFRCHWKARCAGTARMLRWRFESYPLTELCFPQPIWETREKKTSSASQYASASDAMRTMEQRHVTNLLPVKESVWPGDKALPYDLFSSALKLLIGVS